MIDSESSSFSTPNNCGRFLIDGTFLPEPKVHVCLLNQPPCGSLFQIWALSFPSAQPHVSLDLLLDVQATLCLFFRTPARVLSCANGATRLQVGARLRAARPAWMLLSTVRSGSNPKDFPFKRKTIGRWIGFEREDGPPPGGGPSSSVAGSRGPGTSTESDPETARGDDGRRGSAPARLSGPGRFDHEGHGSKRDRCHGIPSNTWRKKDMLTNHVRQDARAMDPSEGRVPRERVRNRHLTWIGVRDAPWIETSPLSKTQGKTTSTTLEKGSRTQVFLVGTP